MEQVMTTVRVAVPRKGRPLEAVLERIAGATAQETVDEIVSTLRYEKALTKENQDDDRDVYERLAAYSDLSSPTRPEYTLFRDDREGMPRRIVFDSVTLPFGDDEIQLIGREEPLRGLRTHEFALGFDSADLVLEEVVSLSDEPLSSLQEVNERISPLDTDVRVATGLGDTVYHTLLGRPDVIDSAPLDRSFVDSYTGSLCISPRYERLVGAILGSRALEGIEFTYPENGTEEEAAIAEAGLGVYLTHTGSTARDNGLIVGESLFPSETVLLTNTAELTATQQRVVDRFVAEQTESVLASP